MVASVSCIYGIGAPEDYGNLVLMLEVGQQIDREEILSKLVKMQYERNDVDFARGKFRVRGDVVEIFPAQGKTPIRVELFGDEVDNLSFIDHVRGQVTNKLEKVIIFLPNTLNLSEKMNKALKAIEEEFRIGEGFGGRKKLVEAHVWNSGQNSTGEVRGLGYCQGIENYSCASFRPKLGENTYSPPALLPRLLSNHIDESHVTVPKIRGCMLVIGT